MIYDNDPRNIFVDRRNEKSGYDNKSNTQQTVNSNTNGNYSNYNTTNGNMYTNNEDINRKVEEMKALAKKYQREGESQLVKDIVNNVIEQKARGNLTNEQLQQFAKRIIPLLNAEQRQRLEGLLQQLMQL